MAGSESGAPFQRIEELEQENEDLRERLEQAEKDKRAPAPRERGTAPGVEGGGARNEAREEKAET